MAHQKSALANIEEMRQRGGPIDDQLVQFSGRTGPQRQSYWDGTAEAGGGELMLTSGQGRMGLIEVCRNRSHSVWLHFPHLELLFLFFAFEGVVAAATSVLKHSGCPAAFYPALVVLVSSGHRPNVAHGPDSTRNRLPGDSTRNRA